MINASAQEGLAAWRRLLRRELLRLGVLVLAGAVTFAATRELASANSAQRQRDAAVWLRAGRQALEQGDTAGALDALRRAAHIDRSSRDVSMSLATALSAAGEVDQAESVLMALRAARPDDADVQLQLARLEASRAAIGPAARYYQDALDALWAPELAPRSRAIRLEFIDLLLQHGERARALSQALMFAADLPGDARSMDQAGRLFLAVGDARRALDRFAAVLPSEPANPQALAGAGEAAFELGQYADARRYLASAKSSDPRVRRLAAVADAVVSADPLAARLSRSERSERIRRLLAHAAERFSLCSSGLPASSERLRESVAAALSASLTPPRRASEEDQRGHIEDQLELAAQAETAASACAAPDPLAEAVPIIARRHGLEQAP
jgi:tetratricopeptide (TPR) repeat protein